MRVKCTHPGLTEELRSHLDAKAIECIADLGMSDCPCLERGLNYAVYGLDRWEGLDGYYIADSEFWRFPTWYPAALFQTTDPRPSRYWMPSVWAKPGSAGVAAMLIPPCAADQGYLEDLIDGEASAVAAFKHYRELMDLEFVDDPARQLAAHLQDNWVQCPSCDDAWEVKDRISEMVRCPYCTAVWLSPFRIVGRVKG